MVESIYTDSNLSKEEKYIALLPQLHALTEFEDDGTANIANVVAALREVFSFFWIGIYFVKETKKGEELVLGPFQGPVACTRIAKGKGVCGSSWEKGTAIVVPDVDLFPGHIACSSASKSEIVLPIIKNNIVVAVLDVDSEFVAHFDDTDEKYLTKVCDLLLKFI